MGSVATGALGVSKILEALGLDRKGWYTYLKLEIDSGSIVTLTTTRILKEEEIANFSKVLTEWRLIPK